MVEISRYHDCTRLKTQKSKNLLRTLLFQKRHSQALASFARGDIRTVIESVLSTCCHFLMR